MIYECVSGMCISECVSLLLHVHQSLTKTNNNKKKENLNECASWMCFHDCTGLPLNMRHLSIVGVFLVFDFLLILVSLNVMWSTASQSDFGEMFNLLWNVLPSSQGQTVTWLRRLQFGQTTLWSKKQMYDHNLSHLSHASSVLIPLRAFLNAFILLSAWSHSVNNLLFHFF